MDAEPDIPRPSSVLFYVKLTSMPLWLKLILALKEWGIMFMGKHFPHQHFLKNMRLVDF